MTTSRHANPVPHDINWYHVTFNTYGTWLPGDPRGFRTRHHRSHVDGHYKRPPPPGTHASILKRSIEAMKRPPVRLTIAQRNVAGECILEMLDHLDALTVALAVGAQHLHVVLECPPAKMRPTIARAKKHASHVLRDHGLKSRVWAKRSSARPIKDRAHQLNAIEYVRRHREKRAWVWIWGDPKPESTHFNPRPKHK